MKQFFKNALVGISLLTSLGASAWSPSYTISVIKVAVYEEPDKTKEPDRGQRIPSAPIECVITSEGIELMSSSVTISDIISFEIWESESEFCMASFPAESDFINALFSMTGEYQIRLVCEDYELIGFIAL